MQRAAKTALNKKAQYMPKKTVSLLAGCLFALKRFDEFGIMIRNPKPEGHLEDKVPCV